MKTALVAVMALSCTAAQADVYRCPAAYPGKDAPALPLSGAMMMFGERSGNGLPFPPGWDTPNDREVEGGIDQHYELPENEQGWLICEYGSRKRVKGRIRNGHEYGLSMEHYGQQSWMIKLAPRDASCTVSIREAKPGSTHESTWTVSAMCRRQ